MLQHCSGCIRRAKCAIEDIPACLLISRRAKTTCLLRNCKCAESANKDHVCPKPGNCKRLMPVKHREFSSNAIAVTGTHSLIETASTSSSSLVGEVQAQLQTQQVQTAAEVLNSQYMGRFIDGKLPEYIVWFNSDKGRKLLGESIKGGHAESYFSLSEQFLTQSAPPSCGPATLAMVLNSLRVDPGRVWRKPWRWFTEEMLVSCVSPGPEGTTMHHFALMAECNGTTAQTFYASHANESFFRALLKKVTTQDKQRLVVCFNREGLGQTGTGHYSPIAAYDAVTDMALILDVARFKYPPYWVPVAKLFASMMSVDPCTGQSRGFFVVSPGEDLPACNQSSMQAPEQDTADHVSHSTSNETETEASESESGCCAHIKPPSQSPQLHQELQHTPFDLKKLLLDSNSARVRSIAAGFVHSIRLRMLDADSKADLELQLKDIRNSELKNSIAKIIDESGSSIQCSLGCGELKICSKDIAMKAPGGCVAALVSVGLSRPLDFFLRSMPQDTAELSTLMLLEKGHELLPFEEFRKIIMSFKKNLPQSLDPSLPKKGR